MTAPEAPNRAKASPPAQRGCALVTGASRGIGAATARGLAADGWAVGVNYRQNAGAADGVASEIVAAGGRALALEADVADPEAMEGMFASLEKELGPILVLVNNAGMRNDGLLQQLDDGPWQQVIETNLSAAFRATRRALRQMIRARFGRIVNVASVAGERARPGAANYAASKAGLLALTRTAAAEVGRYGITVNAVAPGYIDTDLAAGLDEGALEHIPARRLGEPDEVAACIRFLVSGPAAYVNGSVLTVDGGLNA